MTKIIPLVFALFIIGTATAQTKVTADTLTEDQVQTNDTAIYEQKAVDNQAHFKGGNAAWTQFMIHHLQMEVAVRNGAPKGTYVASVKFVVTKKGSLKNIVPQTGTGYGTEQELERLLKLSPKWVPATLKGQPVDSYLIQTLSFKVSQ